MNNDKQTTINQQDREQSTHRTVKRQGVGLSQTQLLTRLENIHRLGRKDVPQQ